MTEISAAAEVVFDLALDIDAHEASMAKSGERAIGGVTSGLIGLDQDVTWRARHFGIPFTMTSRVTEWSRPKRFVDEQVRGQPVMGFDPAMLAKNNVAQLFSA